MIFLLHMIFIHEYFHIANTLAVSTLVLGNTVGVNFILTNCSIFEIRYVQLLINFFYLMINSDHNNRVAEALVISGNKVQYNEIL